MKQFLEQRLRNQNIKLMCRNLFIVILIVITNITAAGMAAVIPVTAGGKPNTFSNIAGFCVSNDKIAIYLDNKNILIFNQEGNFIRCISFNSSGAYTMAFNEAEYIEIYLYREQKSMVYSLEGKLLTQKDYNYEHVQTVKEQAFNPKVIAGCNVEYRKSPARVLLISEAGNSIELYSVGSLYDFFYRKLIPFLEVLFCISILLIVWKQRRMNTKPKSN